MESEVPKQNLGKVKYVESYDFKHPKLFSKEIMRSLRTIHDSLGINLGRIFSSSLRYKVDMFLHKIDQLSADEFVKGIETPSTIYLLHLSGLDGAIILVLPPGFCLHLIERQSGGYGMELGKARNLTIIEEKIISRIVQNINKEITHAWEPFKEFSIEKVQYESKPENMHLATVDPLIVARLLLDIEEQQVEIKIGYTYSLLKEVLNDTILKKDIRSKMEKLNDEEMEGYKRTIVKAKVRLQALLGSTRLSLDEVFNLKDGDVIPLYQKADQPLDVLVNGVKKIKAYPGVIQGRKAVKIFEFIDEINEQELV